jgi:hypothetical protein
MEQEYVKKDSSCAADFSLLNLPKGKSLKPATSSYAQAPQHTVWDDFYYIQAAQFLSLEVAPPVISPRKYGQSF